MQQTSFKLEQRSGTVSRRAVLVGSVLCGFGTRIADAEEQAPIAYGVSALTEGTGMVAIPPGDFRMGSAAGNEDEEPVHRVRITRGFEMSKFEVTQTQWEGVLAEAHPRPGVPLLNGDGVEVSRTPSHFKGRSLPVESVSWSDVQVFLARLNLRQPAYLYRLPTEAEWEYACTAGKTSAASGWRQDNSDQSTHPVGEKQANSFGLHDMQGNVAEWVQDWYGRNYFQESPENDPQGPRTGSYKIFKGGSWLASETHCRAAFRGFEFPESRLYNVGFRVVRIPRDAGQITATP
jgi:formylglycine-generating enzyme required for sulfatase activity